MHQRFVAILAVLVAGVSGCSTVPQGTTALDPTRWEPDIAAFEASDAESMPAGGGILFVGSSSIRLWDLETSFPAWQTINRGFGGSHVEDSVYFYDRIVKPYVPRIIVLYAGDNDINSGKSPEQVLSDFLDFVARVKADFPKTHLAFIAIKPSLSRWDKVGAMRIANALIRHRTTLDPYLHYIDIDTPMIGPDGKPREDLFVDDGLHLNDEGYRVWSAVVREEIEPLR